MEGNLHFAEDIHNLAKVNYNHVKDIHNNSKEMSHFTS